MRMNSVHQRLIGEARLMVLPLVKHTEVMLAQRLAGDWQSIRYEMFCSHIRHGFGGQPASYIWS